LLPFCFCFLCFACCPGPPLFVSAVNPPTLHPFHLGLAKTTYTVYIHGTFGRESTKYTVIYGVYIRFWTTLLAPFGWCAGCFLFKSVFFPSHLNHCVLCHHQSLSRPLDASTLPVLALLSAVLSSIRW
jgi:hypothetical protein